tara:strand:+ start:862 stop:1257 length:396 start_codon:yes stop_codon:yes gene_type:complete
MNRKKMTIKELKVECANRNVGFGDNWTKTTLINRLEEEDEKDRVINNPLKIWNSLHRELNINKAKLANTEIKLQKLIAEKKIMAQDYDEHNKKIKELEKAIETLANTGLFGDYEEVGGMMHNDYDPTRLIK